MIPTTPQCTTKVRCLAGRPLKERPFSWTEEKKAIDFRKDEKAWSGGQEERVWEEEGEWKRKIGTKSRLYCY